MELAYDANHKNSINITNFPNANIVHTPTVAREYYKITPQGLIEYNPMPYVVNFLKSVTDNSIVCFFIFDIVEKVIRLTIVNRTLGVDDATFVLKLGPNLSAEFDISTPNNLSGFLYAAGGKFEFSNSQMEFGFSKNQIKIINFPNKGDIFTPKDNKPIYITINGLKPS